MTHKHPIIYNFGPHFTWRYYSGQDKCWGSQHFDSFLDAEKCPKEELVFNPLRLKKRCKICHAK